MRSELVVFHYHLFPGGVTSVVTLSIRAILAYLPEIECLRLVSGSEGHLQTLRHHFVDLGEGASRPRVEFDVVPEIFYLSRDAKPGDSSVPDTEELKRSLLSRYRGAVWWIHNYHLGKNPVFTQALLEIAAEVPEQRMLFHIHDFPECARFDNLSLLERFIKLPLYPTSTNVRYAVINRRDFILLKAAGLSDSQLFLLNNPVPNEGFPSSDRRGVRRKLETGFADRFPGYVRGAPLLFYPIRTIRRKNALEAGLLARIAGDPVNLIVTLPGISEREAPYSQVVQECFERGTIPGMAGIGTLLGEANIGFQELALATDCVVSSSVQEGFGYLFIDGRRWRKPVLARYLEILEGIEEIIDGESAYFYRELLIPVDRATRGRIAEAYRRKAEAVSPFLPKEAIDRLQTQVENAFSRESVDFSYLSVDDQRRVLEGVSDRTMRREIAEMNREPLEALRRLTRLRPDDIGERIQEHFSLEAFASETARILESFEVPLGSTTERRATGDSIHRNLRIGFATLEHIRLLYD